MATKVKKVENSKKASKKSKNITLFDIYRKQASIAFNYPTVKMCADGDVCTYLRSIVL